MYVLDVKMGLKPHLCSITLVASLSRSLMLKCRSPIPIFDAEVQIFDIRYPTLIFDAKVMKIRKLF